MGLQGAWNREKDRDTSERGDTPAMRRGETKGTHRTAGDSPQGPPLLSRVEGERNALLFLSHRGVPQPGTAGEEIHCLGVQVVTENKGQPQVMDPGDTLPPTGLGRRCPQEVP